MEQIKFEDISIVLQENWRKIERHEYDTFHILEQESIELLDAFLVTVRDENNVVTLSSYGKIEGFLEEYQKELKKLEERSKIDARLPISPRLFQSLTIGGKKYYVVVLQTSNNPSLNVLQVFFKAKGSLYCFNATIPNSWKTIKDVFSFQHVMQMIRSIKE